MEEYLEARRLRISRTNSTATDVSSSETVHRSLGPKCAVAECRSTLLVLAEDLSQHRNSESLDGVLSFRRVVVLPSMRAARDSPLMARLRNSSTTA